MRHLFYIGIIFSFFSTCCYSQQFNIEKKYRGNSFLNKVDMQKLEKDCSREDYINSDYSIQVEMDKRCPLYKFGNYFDHVLDSVDKSKVIYQKNGLTLKLSKEGVSFVEGGDDYSGAKLTLSLIQNNEIKDKITLANTFTNITNFLAVGYQYYYIAPSGDIYTLSLFEMDNGVGPQTWKHYKIDEKKLKFDLLQIYYGSYQITYPDDFSVVPNPDDIIDYNSSEFLECLNDETDEKCNTEHLYFYYLELLKQKTTLLVKKKNAPKDNLPLIKKKIDKLCLSKYSILYDDINSYYPTEVFLCEIKELKQEIKQAEINLAK
ncbi:hypothetical protein A9G28_10725 [Gilliamella sp. Fer1-1]|jgi:hypothetical protein|uniref:hypothetical protein n=1 Tax=Gilliamella sp. Fer1-1 TaxID=3120240 RepID=UPI00080DE088|nr:hypothetical protein [Gilliamella apicola]OCG46161.1 hypothetical protein A9G28_10725 [Gilliamella apicola]